jgi:hypothetical protein
MLAASAGGTPISLVWNVGRNTMAGNIAIVTGSAVSLYKDQRARGQALVQRRRGIAGLGTAGHAFAGHGFAGHGFAGRAHGRPATTATARRPPEGRRR